LVTETVIRGTPIQLANAIITKDHHKTFFSQDLIIEGNAELAQEIVYLFDRLNIDWEEYLSKIIGDIPAHQATRYIRKLSTWVKKAEGSVTQNVSEYIHEEKMWLPTREAMQDFFSEIDVLRTDVDRAEATIKQLKCEYEETP
jgi:ubiquinone biosynthesis protein UbiJ